MVVFGKGCRDALLFGERCRWSFWQVKSTGKHGLCMEKELARMKLGMPIRGYVMKGPAVYGVDQLPMAPRMSGMQVPAVINNCFSQPISTRVIGRDQPKDETAFGVFGETWTVAKRMQSGPHRIMVQ